MLDGIKNGVRIDGTHSVRCAPRECRQPPFPEDRQDGSRNCCTQVYANYRNAAVTSVSKDILTLARQD